MTKTVYLAGPLFSLPERAMISALRSELEKRGYAVHEPWEFCADCATDPVQIARRCVDKLTASDVVLACLDGADVDSGTAFECGFAVAYGYLTIGYRSDFRASGDDGVTGVNAMFNLLDSIVTCTSASTTMEQFVRVLADAVDGLFA